MEAKETGKAYCWYCGIDFTDKDKKTILKGKIYHDFCFSVVKKLAHAKSFSQRFWGRK